MYYGKMLKAASDIASLSHKKALGGKLIPFLWVELPFLWRRPPVGTLLKRRVFRMERESKGKRDKMHTDYLNALHLKDQVNVPMQPSEGGRPRGPCWRNAARGPGGALGTPLVLQSLRLSYT